VDRPLRVRAILATSEDSQTAAAEGRLRPELRKLVSGATIAMPSLKERREDIPGLVDYFVRTLAQEAGIETPKVAPGALRALQTGELTGTVRELRSRVERALVESGGHSIEARHLHLEAPEVQDR
jgi:DNA-binding NtrC family response regulator